MKDYLEIAESFKDLPMTFYPGLIADLVRESYSQQVWKKGGCSNFVLNLEKHIDVPKDIDNEIVNLTCNKCYTTISGTLNNIHSLCICGGTYHKIGN